MGLVEVAAGWFWMGWEHGHPAERPRHRVWLDAFAIARAPVTNAEYARFLDAEGAPPPPWWNRPRFDDPGQPVVGINWFEAGLYCEWLSSERRGRFRLRGGLEDARFPWGSEQPTTASFDRPPLVADTPANPLGLLALSGVCHEWCLDWESERYYSESAERNPPGPPHGTRRVSRGGAWRHQDPWSAVAHRSSLPPDLRYSGA